uniref:Uncharacterized protein n=1 Tax=Opuntia streptacantha TaxID=393608 RepID=A0A7C9DZM3_OPUST
MDIPQHIPRVRKSKRRSNEVKQRVHGTATTTGCPWCLPQPMVGVVGPCCLARTAVHLLLLPICVFLSWPFVFLRGFPVCAVNLPLKKGCIWLQKGSNSTPFYHSSSIIFRVSLD